MIHFLRKNRWAGWLLTFARVFIGIQWLEAGLGKIVGDFSSAGLINSALNGNANPHYGWFTSFLAFTTNSGENTFLFDVLVPWGEVAVGLALIVGLFTLTAATFGLLMNISFVLAGVISQNPTFILLQVLILIGGFNAARIGLDYWMTPWLRRKFNFLHNDIETARG